MSGSFDPATLPTKRVGSGVLLRNAVGEVLLVEPTYKPGWEIPGGLVEPGESPGEAAIRECCEELGIEVELRGLACVHYAEGLRTPGDGVMFVFAGGRTSLSAHEFTLPPDELRSARFVRPVDLDDFLHTQMAARMRAAIEGADTGRLVYLER